ncbi:MAG: hypothetical protein RLZZ255_863, partial [Cyanobacteriota bacterium]
QLLVGVLQPAPAAHQQGGGLISGPLRQCLQRHFGADPGRIPQGDRQADPPSVRWAG